MTERKIEEKNIPTLSTEDIQPTRRIVWSHRRSPAYLGEEKNKQIKTIAETEGYPYNF